MKSKPRFWIVWPLVLAVGAVVYLNTTSADPRYDGMRLSGWLRDFDLTRLQLSSSAKEAVRQIGPAALPMIIGMLQRRDSYLKNRMMGNCVEFRALGFRLTSAYCYQVRAAAACQVLGPKAKAAIPALIAVVQGGTPANRNAIEALVAIGPDAMMTLCGGLTNRAASCRAATIAALSEFGTNATGFLPALAAAVGDPDAMVRLKAVGAMESVGARGGAVVVAALTQALRDEEATIRRVSVALLGSLGAKAKDAIPEVSQMIRDRDPEVSRVAVMSLKAMTLQETVPVGAVQR